MSPEEWLQVYTLACRMYPTPEIAVVALARRYAQRLQEMQEAAFGSDQGAFLTLEPWRRAADMTLIEQALSLLWWRFVAPSPTADETPAETPAETPDAEAARFQTLALSAAAASTRSEEADDVGSVMDPALGTTGRSQIEVW